MPRRIAIAAAIAALAALLFVGPSSAAPAQGPRRIVVVLAPYLTWSDVLSGAMPETRALAERGLVGAMNVRSGATGAGAPTLSRGALQLSAGAATTSDPKAMQAYTSDETVDGLPAADLYRLLYARAAGDAQVMYLGSARQSAANLRTSSSAVIGSLGEALRDAGLKTAAVGNSDPGMSVPLEADRARPAGIVAADGQGRVDLGNVSSSLLATDPLSPFGVRTDQRALERAYEQVNAAGARFVVVDPGDLTRAYVLASASTTEAAGTARLSAVRSTDNIVGMVARSLTRDDLLIVLPPAALQLEEQPPGFAPLIMEGSLDDGTAAEGVVTTPSTRRAGLCTIMDVSATIVRAAGGEPSAGMVGSAIGSAAGGTLEERVELLERLDARALAVDDIRVVTLNVYITTTIIFLLVSTALVIAAGRGLPAWPGRLARALLLLSIAFTPAGLLMFLFMPATPDGLSTALLLVATALVIWLVTAIVTRGRPPGLPVLAVTGLTTVVLLVDQWFGAPLSYATVFGYSPLYAARYYGLGNEMAGAVLGSSMVAAALVLDLFRDRVWVARFRTFGLPIIAAVVVVTAAAPFFGANIGAIAWMTVGFLVAGLMLAGKRVMTWKNALIAAALVIALLAAASAVAMLGAGGGTHLGRAIAGAQQEGPEVLLTMLARKAETNMRIFGRTNWTWLLLAVLVVLGYMRWRPTGEFANTLRRYPALAAAMAGSLVAGFVGYFTEDSGIIIPALALLPVGVAVLDLMLAAVDPGRGTAAEAREGAERGADGAETAVGGTEAGSAAP